MPVPRDAAHGPVRGQPYRPLLCEEGNEAVGTSRWGSRARAR